MEMAVGGALEPVVLAGQMSRRPKGATVPASIEAVEPAAFDDDTIGSSPAAKVPEPKETKRRRRSTAGFEERIGYRFKDSALLEQALTHISALTGPRNRGG